MRYDEIEFRARMAREAFGQEVNRCLGHAGMANLLANYQSVAHCVMNGEYHRQTLFGNMVSTLRRMGFDMSEADTETRPPSENVAEAVQSAVEDTFELFASIRGMADAHPLEYTVVNVADDLMRSVRDDDDLAMRAWRLHEAVTAYLAGDGDCAGRGPMSAAAPVPVEVGRFVGTVHGFTIDLPGDREVPERVIFNPPATVAFWPDGSKTVAKCAEGEEFSEYTGLLVCIAKRHTAVPRHAMFEDVMAKLLRRAERQRPRAGKGGEAA